MDNTLPNAQFPFSSASPAAGVAPVNPAWIISRPDLMGLLARPNPPLVLDVRRTAAWEASAVRVAHALHCPPEQLAAHIQRQSPQSVVVYCVFGHQVSQQACAQLRAAGWDAYCLWGGILGGEDGVDSPADCTAMRQHPLPLVSNSAQVGHALEGSGPSERQP